MWVAMLILAVVLGWVAPAQAHHRWWHKETVARPLIQPQDSPLVQRSERPFIQPGDRPGYESANWPAGGGDGGGSSDWQWWGLGVWSEAP